MPPHDSPPIDHAGVELAEPTADIAAIAGRLKAAALTASRKARGLDRPVLAWTTARIAPVEPVALFERSSLLAADPMVWWRPEDGFSLVGAGRAWAFTGEGIERFVRVGASWRTFLRDAIGPDADYHGQAGDGFVDGAWGTGPAVMGGFSFAPEGPASPEWHGYLAGLLVLPRVSVACDGHAGWLTVSAAMQPDGPGAADADEEVGASLELLVGLLRPGSPRRLMEPACRAASEEEFPPAGLWKETVADAAREVRQAVLKKVVLARGLRVRAAGLDPAHTLRRLRAGYPTCTIFAISRGDRCFLGATPERLVRVHGGEVRAMALAGSAPRGETEDEDRRLGAMLLASPKDRIEHAIVVDVLSEALSLVCASVSVAPAPALLTFSNVQHLYTPIVGRLRDHSTVLDLVERLHPTPAVGGVPCDEALEWIRRHEGLDRGWYAGPVGWMDRTGEGEFAVAIRSALVRRDEAVLYAGCGIMGDSDPDQEYAESNLKLQPMLSALGR